MEYRIVVGYDAYNLEWLLDSYAKEGWRATSITRDKDTFTVLMQRKIDYV